MFKPISTAACCSALALAACGAPDHLSTEAACPPLVEYTPAQAEALGAALRKLPQGDIEAQAIVDYRNLRRLCGAK
jgi:hypothetical protein